MCPTTILNLLSSTMISEVSLGFFYIDNYINSCFPFIPLQYVCFLFSYLISQATISNIMLNERTIPFCELLFLFFSNTNFYWIFCLSLWQFFLSLFYSSSLSSSKWSFLLTSFLLNLYSNQTVTKLSWFSCTSKFCFLLMLSFWISYLLI